jgi:hypothetical protein
MGLIVVVAYKPKEGKASALRLLVRAAYFAENLRVPFRRP